MSIGERRFRVRFERASVSADDFGEPDQSWTELCTSWGLIQPLKGTERFAANQVQSDVDHRIVVRSRRELKDLAPDDRATWNGQVFDIRAVIFRDHTRKEIEILATLHQ